MASQPPLTVTPEQDAPEPIGRWLWAMGEVRRRTLTLLTAHPALSQQLLDWQAELGGEKGEHGAGNSVGSLLYHLAGIELDWLYSEVREEPIPDELMALFPWDVRDEVGRLSHVPGLSLDDHLSRLERVRERLLETYRGMSLEDFQRVRTLPDYEVSPEWVLVHLMHHESSHAGQIAMLLAPFARSS